MVTNNPFGSAKSQDALNLWLDQFNGESRLFARKLLENFRWYSADKTFDLIEKLVDDLAGRYDLSKCWFVQAGALGKSGGAIAYFFRRVAGIGESSVVSIDSISNVNSTNIDAIIIIDDFIGTGQDALSAISSVQDALKKTDTDVDNVPEVVFAAVVGLERGVQSVQSVSDVLTVCAEIVPSYEIPFEQGSTIFPDARERGRAAELISEIGQQLAPGKPLGYGDSQALIGFFFGTPNNTLPIFWSTAGGWFPVVPYGESVRDPSNVLVPPAGLRRSSLQRSPTRSTDELNGLSDLEPDAVKDLADMFGKLHNILMIAAVIGRIGVEDSFLRTLNGAVRALQDADHENTHVRSTLTILPKGATIPASVRRRYDATPAASKVSDHKALIAIAQMFEPKYASVVCTTTGEILGAYDFSMEDVKAELDPLLHDEAAALGMSSAALMSLSFVSDSREQTYVFDQGKRIMSRKGTNWYIHPRLSHNLSGWTENTSISDDLVSKCMRLAIYLSSLKKGGLLCVGDSASIDEMVTDRREVNGAIEPQSVANDDLDILARRVMQDGATIIDETGLIVEAQVTLTPPESVTGAEVDPNSGTRHAAAVRASAGSRALVVVISESGRIRVYKNGRLLTETMG